MTVSVMPNWKKGATPEEFFYECAMIARADPAKCSRVIVVAQEVKDATVRTRVWRHESPETTLVIGILEMGKMAMYAESEP